MAIITIGGNLGSGKSTLATNLAAALHYEKLDIGGIFRKMAREKGVPIQIFYAELKNDLSLDRATDDMQAKLMREKDNLVMQGRMAWYFAKESPFAAFNIFLAVDRAVGAERSVVREEHRGRSIEAIMESNKSREETERERYRTLYGVQNFLDLGHYDFVLDTSRLTVDEVFEKTLTKIKDRLEGDV